WRSSSTPQRPPDLHLYRTIRVALESKETFGMPVEVIAYTANNRSTCTEEKTLEVLAITGAVRRPGRARRYHRIRFRKDCADPGHHERFRLRPFPVLRGDPLGF